MSELTTASSRSPLLAATPIRRGRSGVPLVFNIPLGHMLSLIFRLPGPSPMRVASGGTPFDTPPATPRVTQGNLVALTAAVARAERELQQSAVAMQATSEPSSSESRPAGSREAERLTEESDEEGPRGIPGDYWTSRAGR